MTEKSPPLHALRPFPDDAARSFAACSATPYDGGNLTDLTLTDEVLATLVQNAAKAHRILTFVVDVPWVEGDTAAFVYDIVLMYFEHKISRLIGDLVETENISETQIRFTIPLYLETEHT